MPQKNLLLTLDAFNTLFYPRLPIAKQYHLLAKRHLSNPPDPQTIEVNFRSAFKTLRQQYPNYGKANALSPEKWWGEVITQTFAPREASGDPNFDDRGKDPTSEDINSHNPRRSRTHPLPLVGGTPPVHRPTSVPEGLINDLLHHFSTNEAYTLSPSAGEFLKSLKGSSGSVRDDGVKVGVISNSDPRVTSILTSLGVMGMVDFTVTSWEVGVGKPSPEIFREAERRAGRDASLWRKVHVGDSWEEDVLGAEGAGWEGILFSLDGQEDRGITTLGDGKRVRSFKELASLLGLNHER
ncbi:HAD-like protein [Piedraia hortae CBS 480.64]|uniref:HAD-like protein n=1 Tax=Piedraia hortae CBS 480.64 TaxID=1314780 RepID=A0A6A7C4F9_9PEZI|nr:HAD-like protein [Piedraia hortae CBS 480.64]